MANGVLVTNAREAWLNAKFFCEQILDGNPSLQTRKLFVSTLENASELILKQIMINQNCASVVDTKKDPFKNDVNLLNCYNQAVQSNNLNQFLLYNSSKDFFSISFSAIIGKLPDILQKDIDAGLLQKNLELLRNLRNPETHFDIDRTFLTESEFASLLSIMIVLNEIVFSNAYNPLGVALGFGEDSSFENLLFFKCNISNPSYKDLIINSKTNQKIAAALAGTPYIRFNRAVGEFEILNAYFPEINALSISFSEFVSRIQLLEDYHLCLVSIDPVTITDTDANGIDQDVSFDNPYFSFDASLLQGVTN